MGLASFIITAAGILLTLLGFLWDIKFLPEGFANLKMPVLSILLPVNMTLLIIGLATGIVTYLKDIQRGFSMMSIIFSAFFGLVTLNNIFVTFEILDKIKF